MIQINYLSEIEQLYIFLDDEIIDLTNVKDEKFLIVKNQTFYIKLLESKIGFLIKPSESVLNGEINFYFNKTEKYKSRELETDETCFYIEKMDYISDYYININISDYIVYKFILMEDFDIINEANKYIVPSYQQNILYFHIKKVKFKIMIIIMELTLVNII